MIAIVMFLGTIAYQFLKIMMGKSRELLTGAGFDLLGDFIHL